jgi:uncharacterized membrane protein YccC
VNRLEILRRWLRAWMRKHRVELALTLRMTVAAVAGLWIAQALALPLPLWTVLTALIVTQMSIGRSLKTSVDYFVGTVGGTIYARRWRSWFRTTPRWRCCWCWSSRWRRSPWWRR